LIVASLTRQALVVSAARLLNQGLMVISPLILVRLLAVDDFGLYREFLLYAAVVGNLAVFSLPNSLLYFVGREPASAWVFVDRIVVGVGVTSLLAVSGFMALSAVLPEPLVEGRLLLCAAYVLFFTNVDFWEFLWFAQKRPAAVFAYSSGRLAARLVVVVTAAWITRDIDTMLWSLLAMEGVRLMVSLVAWRKLTARPDKPRPRAGVREMLEFCVPSGLAVFVTTLSSSLSGIVVDQTLGTAALAQFVIGGYVFMSIFPLRNAISDVLLPELAMRSEQENNGWIPVWKRSVVVVALMLVPLAIGLAWYSEEFIRLVFSEKYLASEPVFRAYCVLIALSCFDFALVYRAINRTRSMLLATIVTVAVNMIGLLLLVPRLGMAGAGVALVVANIVALGFAMRQVSGLIGVAVREFLPTPQLARVVASALLASAVFLPVGRNGLAGPVEILVSCLAYVAAYVLALKLMRVQELSWALDLVRRRNVPWGRNAG
jgi:O-antigen/teichoic acid export membrane protein